MTGVLRSINVSNGGVPKLARAHAVISVTGIIELCLYSLELIEALQAEGHPVAVGALGEKLTSKGRIRAGAAYARVLREGTVRVGDPVLLRSGACEAP